MSFSYLKVIWIVVHFLADLIEAIYYFGFELRENFINFIKTISKPAQVHDFKDDRLIIESRIREIKKHPKHLAVILNANSGKDVDVELLTNLVLWSLSSGVEFISFYDYKGIVKHELSSSFQRTIEHHVNKSESDNIVWGPSYQHPTTDGIKFPHKNGFKRHIVINLYSSDDGHVKFSELLTKELCSDKDGSEKCESKKLTIDYIDDKLSKLYGQMPDPDLAVFFGNHCCTMGFMPWQIRLTEFIQISYKLHQLTLDKYIQVLYKFAKCEQRFGK